MVGLDVRVPDARRWCSTSRTAACCTRPATPRCASRSPSRSAQGVPWGISESAYAGQRPHAGLPVRAAGRAAAGAAPHAARRTGDRALRHRAGGADRAAPRLPQLRRAGSAGARAGATASSRRWTSRRRARPAASRSRRCSTFMAHHQGMSIVALANVLLDGVRAALGHGQRARRGRGVAAARARAARGVDAARAAAGAASRRRCGAARPACCARCCPGAAAVEPTQLLSNGRYSVALRANGAGWSRWGADRHHALARRRAARRARQLLLPALGPASRSRCRITQHPAPDPAAHYQQRLPRRPRVLRRHLARAAGPHHGVGQPGGRHRVPPGRAAQPGRRARSSSS